MVALFYCSHPLIDQHSLSPLISTLFFQLMQVIQILLASPALFQLNSDCLVCPPHTLTSVTVSSISTPHPTLLPPSLTSSLTERPSPASPAPPTGVSLPSRCSELESPWLGLANLPAPS